MVRYRRQAGLRGDNGIRSGLGRVRIRVQVAAQISRRDAVVAINKSGLIRPFSDSVLFQNYSKHLQEVPEYLVSLSMC